jgi:hypothetical protein
MRVDGYADTHAKKGPPPKYCRLLFASFSIPWYTTINGHLYLYGPTTWTFTPNPSWNPNDPSSSAGGFSGTVSLFDLGSLSTASWTGGGGGLAFAAPWYFRPKGPLHGGPYRPNQGPTLQKPPINPTGPPPQPQWIDEWWRETLGLFAKLGAELEIVIPAMVSPCPAGGIPQLGPNGHTTCPPVY